METNNMITAREKFSYNMKHLREKKGVTKYQMSKESSLSYSYLSKLESGENGNPSMDVIDIIASYLGVEVYELFK